MTELFFDGWPNVLRVALAGVLAYLALIVFVRVSGKRTLSKMNAFDFLVTIALGSTLSTAVLDKNVSLAESGLAFAVLIGLQYGVSWSSVRWRAVRRLARSSPTLLLREGRFIAAALQDQRVTEDDVRAAVRGAGVSDFAQVLAVVLETDGSMSVVRTGSAGSDALQGVQWWDSGGRRS